MEQNQMTTASTSKRSAWKACAFYLLPETKKRLDHYLLRLRLDGIDSATDQSDIVNEALLLWLNSKESNDCKAAENTPNKNEIADLVDLVVSLQDNVKELQKKRKSQIPAEEQWVSKLRLRIKRDCGRGWLIDAVGKTKLNPSGKCRLTKIAADRSRTSVVLPYAWLSENAELIYLSADFMHWKIHKDGCTLQEAMSGIDFTK
jgi:hypothetical protein